MTTSGQRPHRHGRTWFERAAITATIVTAVLCFVAAGSLVAGYMVLRNRDVVAITNPAEEDAAVPEGADSPARTAAPGETLPPEPSTTETFPPADERASNFLLTGADNGACVDPDSPFAGAFGDARSGRVGERSDTIMIMRVDPAAKRVAVLSFPRDLYVRIAGAGNRARINSAYRRDDPQRLINTIYENFGVGTDHFIQVDFCTFKTLVDAVGGVTVPFEYPARDRRTGLNVPDPGCFTFDGDHALAYVRSRYYEYEDPAGSGQWRQDPSSDLGRISRQQDFLRRTLSSVLSKGLLNPSVARGLISAATSGDVVTSDDLSLAKLMEFAGVLEPRINGDNMQAVLAMFRGESSLADAPVQSFEPTTTPVERPSDVTTATTRTTVAPATTAPAGSGPEEINVGIVPPRNVECP
jgi:LCP family protein required for cell wall assembly